MAPGPRRGHRLACLLQSEKDAFDLGLHEPHGIRGKLASPAKGADGIMQALWEALHGGKVNGKSAAGRKPPSRSRAVMTMNKLPLPALGSGGADHPRQKPKVCQIKTRR